MITLQRNKQKMFYSNQGDGTPIYETDEYGNIKYSTYTDFDGNEIPILDEYGEKIPIDTGEIDDSFHEPIEFSANINNKLNEVLIQQFGIDDSTNYCQMATSKGYLLLKAGDLIWKQSEVGYKSDGSVDDTSADYIVKGIADEGLSIDLFLLRKNVK